jgi:iron complex outermembrane receptor protein
MNKVLISAAIAAALCGHTLCAQIVEGEVKDSDGYLLSNVVLKVKGFDIETKTNANGQFTLDLQPGQYTLDVKGGSKAHFLQEINISKTNINQQVLITLQDEPVHKLVIRAHPLEHTSLDMATPTILMGGEELMLKRAGTLGEILMNEPGISMSSFGPAAARPVIRGLSGSRVQITNNQMIVQDASTTSGDHDVGIEPLLAEQIEVVKGPATLLYGSGAIGGIVNVTDNKINPNQLDGISGGIELRLGDGATGEQTLIFALDGGNNDWNIHLDGYRTETDDIEIPGFAESERLHELEEAEHAGEDHDEHDENEELEVEGILENSSMQTHGGSVGITRVDDWGYFGAAVSFVDKVYAVPGHAHHGEEEEHGEEHEEEHEEEGHSELEESVFIDMKQTRYDLQTKINDVGSFDHLFIGYSFTDYEHVELEGAEIGTQFDNEAWELKSYVKHNQWLGWQGVGGIQFNERDFSAIGEEAFIPPSETTNSSIFLLEEKSIDNIKLELGFRYESQKVQAVGHSSVESSDISYSAGVVYSIKSHNKLAFNFSHATRFASVEELFSNGAHLATRSFEIGNPNLNEEVSNNFDVSYRFETDKLRGEFNVYLNQFNDYIYGEVVSGNDSCVSNDAAEEAEREELQVVCYKQEDADFSGVELKLDYELGNIKGHDFSLGLIADFTEAELSSGDYVPRIPPMKYGLMLNHDYNNFSTQLSWINHDAQNRISSGELATDSFDILDFEVLYRINFGVEDLVMFFKGKNLLDEEARDHASLLKDLAPRVGRNFVLGARYTF